MRSRYVPLGSRPGRPYLYCPPSPAWSSSLQRRWCSVTLPAAWPGSRPLLSLGVLPFRMPWAGGSDFRLCLCMSRCSQGHACATSVAVVVLRDSSTNIGHRFRRRWKWRRAGSGVERLTFHHCTHAWAACARKMPHPHPHRRRCSGAPSGSASDAAAGHERGTPRWSCSER